MTESALYPAELSSLQYRLANYEALLESFQTAGYKFSSFDSDGPPEHKEILLRHDVDLSLGRALAMAELERELGVRSTYCVLLSAPVYDLTAPQNVRTLKRISKLGHDIGLHFDSHRYWNAAEAPSAESVAANVAHELAVLSRLIGEDLSTASFHIPPDWVLDREFGTFTNTYAPQFFSEIGYVSDSSQKWCTDDPFPNGLADTFQLLVHPGLWHTDHRPMSDIVEEIATHSHRRVESYFDRLG